MKKRNPIARALRSLGKHIVEDKRDKLKLRYTEREIKEEENDGT